MNIKDLSTDQIRSIIVIKKKIEKLHKTVEKRVEKLQAKIDSIAGNGGMPGPSKKKRRMSRAGRAAIAAGARARWAKIKGTAKASK
jgi:predicted RecB family endonuclease